MAGIPTDDVTPDPAAAAETVPATTEEPKPGDPAVATEQTAPVDEDFFDLDPEVIAAVDPESFNKLLEDKPEFKNLLEADPELKEALYKTAREAAELKPYREIFPDVESAKFARENASTFVDVRNTFLGSVTPEGTAATLGKIAELCYERDDQGKVLVGDNGQPVIGEDFFGFIDNTVKSDLEHWATEVEQSLVGNALSADGRDRAETVMAALTVLLEHDRFGKKDGTEANAQFPEELRAKAAELDRREQALNQRTQNDKVQDRVTFEKSVVDEGIGRMKGAIDKIIASVEKQGAFIAPFIKEALKNSMGRAVVQAMKDDPKLVDAVTQLQRLPINEESRRRRLEQIDKVLQDRLPAIARAQLREAGVQTLKGSEAKRNKIAAQEQQSRTEPKGPTGNANPQGAPVDENQAMATATAFWQKQNPGKHVDSDAKGRIANLMVQVLLGRPLA
jgi:hypothetical protein